MGRILNPPRPSRRAGRPRYCRSTSTSAGHRHTAPPKAPRPPDGNGAPTQSRPATPWKGHNDGHAAAPSRRHLGPAHMFRPGVQQRRAYGRSERGRLPRVQGAPGLDVLKVKQGVPGGQPRRGLFAAAWIQSESPGRRAVNRRALGRPPIGRDATPHRYRRAARRVAFGSALQIARRLSSVLHASAQDEPACGSSTADLARWPRPRVRPGWTSNSAWSSRTARRSHPSADRPAGQSFSVRMAGALTLMLRSRLASCFHCT